MFVDSPILNIFKCDNCCPEALLPCNLHVRTSENGVIAIATSETSETLESIGCEMRSRISIKKGHTTSQHVRNKQQIFTRWRPTNHAYYYFTNEWFFGHASTCALVTGVELFSFPSKEHVYIYTYIHIYIFY